MSDGLTPKQDAFCQRYIETGNASQAYRLSYNAAKMKPETVNRTAKELLDNPKIAARLGVLKERLLEKHDVTFDRVVKEYARLAFLDIRRAFDEQGNLKPIHELDDDTAAAIAGLEVEVRRAAGDADEMLEGQPHGGALKRQHGAAARLHKIKLADKKGALDSIAKLFGWVVEKKELTGKDGAPLIPVTKEQRDAAVAAALAADS